MLPRIIITTSRNPTQMTRTFCNDLTHSLLNARKITRGKSNLDKLAERALEHSAERIIVTDRWKGGVGKINLFTLSKSGLTQIVPIIYVKNVKPRRAFRKTHSGQIHRLVLQIESKTSLEAHRFTDVLANFLGIQKQSSEEALTSNFDAAMNISLNKTRNIQITFLQTPTKIEVGPQIILSHLW